MDIDVECEARWLLEAKGFALDDAPDALELATCWLGPEPIIVVGSLEVWGDGEVEEVVEGEWKIFVRSHLSPQRLQFTICHELAEWHLKQIGYQPEHFSVKEEVADRLAAALIAPRGAFRAAVRRHDYDFEQLALDFGTDQTCSALRLGEVEMIPLLAIGPRVRVRGPEFGWPKTIDQLRRLAAKTPLPGIRKAQLTDDPSRVVLMATA